MATIRGHPDLRLRALFYATQQADLNGELITEFKYNKSNLTLQNVNKEKSEGNPFTFDTQGPHGALSVPETPIRNESSTMRAGHHDREKFGTRSPARRPRGTLKHGVFLFYP